MARIARKNLKVFADSATNNGVFGSFQAGNPTVTNDVETIQSLSAWGEGWNAATMTSKKLPPLQEFQAVQYVNSYQTAYILQEGVPEWDSSTAYYEGSWVKSNASGEWKMYQSLANNNTGNAVTDTSKWQSVSFGGGLEVGDIGIAAFGIDETLNRRRYLNGQVISQTQFGSFTTFLKNAISKYPSLGTTEALWQQAVTNSDLGQCGQFVVDNVNGTIRLPKIVNIQGLQTLSGNLGTTISAGLPNITGEFGLGDNTGVLGSVYSGAFGLGAQKSYEVNSGLRTSYNANFDASRSNSIYGNSNTVQEEAVQYPYFIQVATGGETNVDVTTEIQLSNPFFFSMYQWFQTDPNNASWLEANGAYNAKTVYPSYYDWLLSIYNDTGSITGFNVKDTTDTYTNADFVLNLNDETFRLPLEVDGEPASTTDMTLYFYVGAVVQDADVINAGAVINEVAELNSRIHIVETYHSGTDWYRVWSDGFCEQGGLGTENVTTNLLKPYADTNYSVLLTPNFSGNFVAGVASKTTTGFVFSIGGDNTGSSQAYWFACGYIS